VNTKLAGWKASPLSLVGRITLAKTAIQPIPAYPMLTMIIPQNIIAEIQKVQKAFIWGTMLSTRGPMLLIGR